VQGALSFQTKVGHFCWLTLECIWVKLCSLLASIRALCSCPIYIKFSEKRTALFILRRRTKSTHVLCIAHCKIFVFWSFRIRIFQLSWFFAEIVFRSLRAPCEESEEYCRVAYFLSGCPSCFLEFLTRCRRFALSGHAHSFFALTQRIWFCVIHCRACADAFV